VTGDDRFVIKNYDTDSKDLETLTVTELAKKFPAFLLNPKVHYRVYKNLPLLSILSQINPIHILPNYCPIIHLILSFNISLGLLTFSSQNSVPVSHFVHASNMPRQISFFLIYNERKCVIYFIFSNVDISGD
jgi:hypothetical protein